MNQPLKEHIAKLQKIIETLTEQLMGLDGNGPRRNVIEAEIRAASLALSHYRAALDIERGLQTSHS
jgi:hypothetical protein